MIAKLRTHSPAGERQFSHKPASAIRRRSANALAPPWWQRRPRRDHPRAMETGDGSCGTLFDAAAWAEIIRRGEPRQGAAGRSDARRADLPAMQRRHCDDSQRAFPPASCNPDMGPRESQRPPIQARQNAIRNRLELVLASIQHPATVLLKLNNGALRT